MNYLPDNNSQDYFPWQLPVLEQFYGVNRAKDQFPHALLFSGVAGIGKRDFVFYLTRILLCHSHHTNTQTGLIDPCQVDQPETHCRSCQLFSAKTHPDLYHITTPPDKKVIPIDRIRDLLKWSILSSQLGGKKVIVIEPADAMNINASNSLLKTLEEPVSDTIILLVTHNKHSLLATIRSRCRAIDMLLPEQSISLPWLKKQNIPNPDLMLSLASGAPLLALQLCQDDQLEVRDFIIKNILSIVLEDADPVRIAEQLFKQTKVKVLAKKAKLTQKQLLDNKHLAMSAYEVIYWFDAIVADVSRLMHNCDQEMLTNIDYYEHLQPLVNTLYLKNVLQLSDTINKAYLELQGQQSNLNMLFEQLLIDWNNCKK